MGILSNEWVQSIVIPIFLILAAQLLYILSKRSSKITANDFSSLPYALGTSSIAINAALAIGKHTLPNDIARFYACLVLLILAMIAIAMLQRFVRQNLWIVNGLTTAFSMFLMAVVFALWR